MSRPTPTTATSVSASPSPSASHSSSSSKSLGQTKKKILKVILLGSAGTGKTSLLNRFVDNTYQPVYKATLGADTRDVEVTINDEPVVLQIWDTAGQERFNSLTQMFLKGSDMVLLVFDLTRSDSFESLAMWRDQFLASTRNDGETFPMALVAAKSDMAIHRAVSQKRANTWCSANGNMSYTECSAKDGVNVHQAFMDLARKAMKKIQTEREAEHAAFAQPPPNVVLPTAVPLEPRVSKKSKKSNCCA